MSHGWRKKALGVFQILGQIGLAPSAPETTELKGGAREGGKPAQILNEMHPPKKYPLTNRIGGVTILLTLSVRERDLTILVW